MKVSIITPSYNQGRFIERTLQSVADQNALNVIIEHVVFDGGSNDETVDILRRHSHQVRWISQKDNGQADAVNKGIQSTDGNIIGWLNSDDIYYPDAIIKIVDYFQAHPDIDVVYGMADHIDLEDHAFEAYPTEPWSFERLQETCFICQPSLFMRRRVVDQHGYLNDKLNYCMDYEYWLRLGTAGVRFAYLDQKIAGSRLYADNKTLGARVKVHKEINNMFKGIFGKVPDRWLLNYAHAVVEAKRKYRERDRFFILELVIATLFAVFRWNGGLSRNMKDILSQWMGSIFRVKANG